MLIGYEVVIGLFFGTLLRMLISSLETAGTVIGMQTGLSNATILNPALAAQSTLPSAMLSVVGVTLHFCVRARSFPVSLPGVDLRYFSTRRAMDAWRYGTDRYSIKHQKLSRRH